MKASGVLIVIGLILISSNVANAQLGPFRIEVTKPILLLNEKDTNGIRTSVWIPADPYAPYSTDPTTGEEYETNVERGTLAFAVVNDRSANRYRRIDIIGSMITIRNYCTSYNETHTRRNRTQIQLYVYNIGQDYANMLDCDGRQINYVPVYEIDRIFSLVREVPPSLMLTMMSIRISLAGATANARGQIPRRD